METVDIEVKRASMDFNEVLEQFVTDCQLRGLSEKTIIGYKSCISTFMNFLSTKGLSLRDVNNQVLKEFLGYLKFKRSIKHKTVKEYFSALSALYDYLAFEGKAKSNIILPFRAISKAV